MTSVLIEGLDGTGKSTLVALLAERMGAARIATPARAIAGFRSHCHASPALREGYYATANFLCSEEMKTLTAAGTHCVIDRYLPSTYSYLYGADVRVPADAPVPWPPEIARPDFMFVLLLDNDERVRRVLARGAVTPEEERINQNPELARRINAFYLRAGCTPVPVGVDDSPAALAERVIALMGERAPAAAPRLRPTTL